MAQGFKSLLVWQEGVSLNIALYTLVKDSREFWLREQILRSSLSIPSNIAEGYNRKSVKESIYFFAVARASCAELLTQIHISGEIGVISQAKTVTLIDQCEKISAMIYRLIESRKRQVI